MQHIDRTSSVPYYEQLFEILRSRIVSGQHPSDQRLPSEVELGREFGLARATVRQTLAMLESEGFARRVPRRGVFATTPGDAVSWTVQDGAGFLESQLRHARTGITTRVIAAGYQTPPPHVQEALEVAAGQEVFSLSRVRYLNGVAALFSTNWFPADSGAVIAGAVDVLDGSGSANHVLRRAGFLLVGARRVIHALPVPPEVGSQLGVDPGAATLRLRSLSWGRRGHLFDYYETWVLTDVVPLEVGIVAS